MSTSNLPPLRNLPSWSRVRDLDRVRYPRLLSSDPVVRSPHVVSKSPKAAAQPRTDAHSTRIASLEKDILFLQQQHKDTLERLHAETEELKRVNKGVLLGNGAVWTFFNIFFLHFIWEGCRALKKKSNFTTESLKHQDENCHRHAEEEHVTPIF